MEFCREVAQRSRLAANYELVPRVWKSGIVVPVVRKQGRDITNQLAASAMSTTIRPDVRSPAAKTSFQFRYRRVFLNSACASSFPRVFAHE